MTEAAANTRQSYPSGGAIGPPGLQAPVIAYGDLVEIAVSDTGAGIVPEISAQLFHSFVTTKSQGMGVGLSISRTIVEAQGSSIAQHPNPGGGTKFSFTLTAVTAEEAGDGD